MKRTVGMGVRLAALLAAPMLMANCAVCTEIGCAGGLLVKVQNASGTAVSTFSGEARFDGRTVAFRCDAASHGNADYVCQEDGVRLNAAPTTVELTVTDMASTPARFEATLTPDYATTRPNGDACPPECQNATVTAALQ